MHSLSLIGALLLCVFLFGLLRPSVAQTSPKPRADEDPRTALELYFQAHALGKAEFIEQTFTPDAKIKFVDAGELKEWTRDEFAKFNADEIERWGRIVRGLGLQLNQ